MTSEEQEKLKKDFQASVDKGLAPIKEKAENAISKEQLDDAKKELNEELTKAFNEGLEKAIEEKGFDKSVAELKTTVKELNEKLFKQGEVIANQNKAVNISAFDTLLIDMEEQYKEATSAEDFKEKKSKVSFTTKATDLLTHTYNDVAVAGGGTVTGVDTLTQTWFSQIITDVIGRPRQDITWFLALNTLKLEKQSMSVIELCNEDGNVECVAECDVKPTSKVTPKVSSSENCTLATRFVLTRQYRKHFAMLLPQIRRIFEALIYEKAQEKVFEKLFENHADFQNLRGEEIAVPNIVNAVNGMITEMQMLNTNPTTLFLDYGTFNDIKNTEDGQGRIKYACCNGQIDPFNIPLKIVVGNFVPKGEIFLGDLTKAYVGVEDGIESSDGTVKDGETNEFWYMLETDINVLVPDCNRGYFMHSTIADAKALITA